MNQFDRTAMHLVEEFLAGPRGPHSDELQRVLNLMRRGPVEGKFILVFDRTSSRYRIARLGRERGAPVTMFGVPVFDNLDDAERSVFLLRWQELGGALPAGVESPTLGPRVEPPRKTITGYADSLSVAPGERLQVMVSCNEEMEFQASIVRLVCADSSPAGPGFKEEAVPSKVDDKKFTGRRQETHAGSCMLVELSEGGKLFRHGFAFHAWILATLPEAGRETICSYRFHASGFALTLSVDPDTGAAVLLELNGGQSYRCSVMRPVVKGQWYFVAASYCTQTGTARVIQRPLRTYPGIEDGGERSESWTALNWPEGAATFTVAASTNQKGQTEAHFNGKIEAPTLYGRAVGNAVILGASSGERLLSPCADLVAAWDFSEEMSSDRVIDRSPNRLHGTLLNAPTRAVRGHNWTGEILKWQEAPEQYGAIHFHEDDVLEARWEPSLSWKVPEETRSGFYAVRVVTDGEVDYIPFFVRVPRKSARAPLAFLVPTATYLAYANYRNWADLRWAERLFNSLWVADTEDLVINEKREYGASLYDVHKDESGIVYSSWRRPLLNVRPKLHFVFTLNADSHVIDWLEAKSFPYDVITDEDLHAEGLALLSRYRLVITGTHPEYYSAEMLDALEGYLERGGRLLYSGGNGFYWRIAFHPSRPGVIEVRKANGSRNWFSEPGEGHHSFDGTTGGIWREQGRPPNRLVGVGFTAVCVGAAGHYVRQPGSFDPRAAFIFEGIGTEERIGDFGSIGGGAAGLETDRSEPRYGTLPHALLLASSRGHSRIDLPVVEDQTFLLPGLDGTMNPDVRADMVFFETPNGGAVFSTGSIVWASALAHDNYDNNVSRIMQNVVRRFLDPTPFSPLKIAESGALAFGTVPTGPMSTEI